MANKDNAITTNDTFLALAENYKYIATTLLAYYSCLRSCFAFISLDLFQFTFNNNYLAGNVSNSGVVDAMACLTITSTAFSEFRKVWHEW